MKDKYVSTCGAVPSQTSLTLLELVKQNEKEAWHRLVDLYAPLIYGRCRRHWNLPPPEAENIAQEVFASVARKVVEFERQRNGSFRTWLRTIADNKCRDHLRKIQAATAAGGSAAREILENVPDPDVDDTEHLSMNDGRTEIMRTALQGVRNEFSDRDLQIFWNVVVENRDRQDIASAAGVSDNVVYIVCSRIRKRLREIFEDLIDPDILEEQQ